MKLYDNITNKVRDIIKKYGQPIKVTNISGSTTSTYGVWGKVVEEEVNENMIGNITSVTREIYLPYIKNEPQVGGFITVNKITYSIISVTKYQPTDKSIGYKIEVKS